jgi:hypothetical protein
MSAAILLALIGIIGSGYHAAPAPVACHAPGPVLTAGSPTVFWYDEGHRLVGRLAEGRLTPQAAAAVHALLGGQSLADAALWADRIRVQRPDTKPLHYVNIPLAASGYLPARDCPTGRCIIAAIERDRLTLADTHAALAARAEALRFLTHLIGDLHQPLHVADDGDRGGNDRRVTFLGLPKNLHEVWDGELIEASGLSEEQYYARLRRRMDSLDLTALERGTAVDWALEGHALAAQRAYRLPHGATIDRGYVEASLPSVDRALIAAGVRLARVLNEALRGDVPMSRALTTPSVYTDLEAAAHVGETATVVGTVATVHRSRGGNIYLNFGADYPHQTFSGAVLHPQGAWTVGLDSLAGKRVGLRGRISVYKGQVQMLIEHADQIVAPLAR